jgi:2-polyprenyl-3-methyl-5-hydroxy-6-metoxy-1,4-benzoquinol methylase
MTINRSQTLKKTENIVFNTKCPGCRSPDIHSYERISDIYFCKNCSLFFVNPRPSGDFFSNYYSKDYYESQILSTSTIERTQQRLDKILPYISSGNLLDVGCGNGLFLNLSSKYFNTDGIDTSESSKMFIQNKFNKEITVTLLEDFGIAKKYDIITMFHVLEHVYDIHSTITQCSHLLQERGYLIIAVPNDANKLIQFIKWFMKHSINHKITQFPRLTSQSESHVNYFTDYSLKKICTERGFHLVYQGIDPIYTKTKNSHFTTDDIYYLLCSFIHFFFKKNYFYATYQIYKKDA